MSSSSPAQTIRVFLADDHEMVRQGLRNMLEKEEGVSVVAEADNGRALLDGLEDNPCEIIVLDLSMPGLSGMDVIRELAQTKPDIKIIVLTMHREPQFFRQATSSRNVYGYLLKDDAFEQLRMAVTRAATGGRAFSPQVQELLVEDYQNIQDGYMALDQLTRREKEILRLIVQGQMNKEIANDLFISVRTVESHRARIMEKLGTKNFAELMRFAAANGLV